MQKQVRLKYMIPQAPSHVQLQKAPIALLDSQVRHPAPARTPLLIRKEVLIRGVVVLALALALVYACGQW